MEEPKGTAKRRAKTAAAAQEDKITLLPLSEMHDFPNHPFKVRDDEAMQETTESIRQYGVLVPAIVRPREDGGYEIIAGHRRRHGSELAGLSAMPCIVRQMDDDTATILMVDSNIQRENILPSERAQAYKMKLEAIRRKAGRPAKAEEIDTSENGGQNGHDLRGIKSRELLAENSDDSARTIQRYIRLTELSPELQQMVDENKIGMTPAVEISYLKPEEQQMLLTAIDSEQAKIIKLKAERAKNDEKIAALRSRNRELDESIVELENTDIIGLARATGMSMEELAQFLTQLKRGGAPFITPNTKEDTDYVHEEE